MLPCELEKLVNRHKAEGHLVSFYLQKRQHISRHSVKLWLFFQPFFVNCTTGTTVYGAFDPIEEIADICEKNHIWLHIDVSKFPQNYKKLLNILISFQAAWGGGLLMSRKYRALKFKGIERYVIEKRKN